MYNSGLLRQIDFLILYDINRQKRYIEKRGTETKISKFMRNYNREYSSSPSSLRTGLRVFHASIHTDIPLIIRPIVFHIHTSLLYHTVSTILFTILSYSFHTPLPSPGGCYKTYYNYNSSYPNIFPHYSPASFAS